MAQEQTQGQPPTKSQYFVQALQQFYQQNPDQLFELWQGQDRINAIVRLCLLDKGLEELLRVVMIQDESVDTLLTESQELQSFSSKRKLAYALGLLPRKVSEDLKYLNKIRNKFAHNDQINSFDESPVREWCQELSTAQRKDDTQVTPHDAHAIAIMASCRFLEEETEFRKEEAKSRNVIPRERLKRWPIREIRWYEESSRKSEEK